MFWCTFLILCFCFFCFYVFFFKQKTAYDMRISDWSSDVCSSDLTHLPAPDIQYHFVPAMLEDHGRTKVKGHGFSCHACVLRPESREIGRASCRERVCQYV